MKQYLNYIGSKYSLIPFIDQAIQTIIQQYPDDKTITVGDICAGAGSVSNYLEKRYPQVCVVANDIEYYSKKFKSQKQLENELIVEYIFVFKKSN